MHPRIARYLSAGLAALASTVAAPAPAEGPPVLARPLAEIARFPERSAPATVVSLNEPRLAAEVAGVVSTMAVLPGEQVPAGAVLARIDCRDYELERERAQARLESLDARIALARKRLERARALREQQTIATERVDERRSELLALEADRRAAQASRRRAAIDVERCTVEAPFPALVIERLAGVGDYARDGDPLLRVLDTSALEVSAYLADTWADALTPVAEPRFVSRGRSFPVRLRAIVGAIDTARHNREARLQFTAEPAVPGAAGELRWRDPRPHVAAELLVERDGRHGVFYAEDGRARFHAVPGAEPGRPIALPALARQTALIVEGHLGLVDGQRITVQAGQ